MVLSLLAAASATAQTVHSIDPDRATDAYLSRLSDEARERSDAYFEGGYFVQLVHFLYGVGVGFLFLATGWSVRLRTWAENKRGPGVAGNLKYVLPYLVYSSVATLPLAVYTGFFREHQYGLSNHTFGSWFRDHLVGSGVGLVMGGLAISGLYLVIRHWPRRWWLIGAIGGILFMSFLLLVAPVYIAPLFNDYQPVQDIEVRESVLRLARANGVPADDVYQFNASRQSTRISANVSGMFATTRISLNDNLLERCTLEEIEAVMAHEIGHYALNHGPEMLLSFGIVLLFGFALVDALFDRFRARFGVQGIGDIAGLPLLGILLSAYMFLMTPVLNSIVRTNEAEADMFGLNVARQPDGFAEVALKLSEYRKLSPGPLEELIFFDHPSGRARIHMAMSWKAAQRDAPR
jgi:STE24 endopeptidase